MSTWPVTPEQRRRLKQLAASDWAALSATTWRAWAVHGPLDLEALAQACREVAAGHSALTASYARSTTGVWRAENDLEPGVALQVRDRPGLRHLPPGDQAARALADDQYAWLPGGSPRFRLYVSMIRPDDAVAVLTGDPLAVDEISMSLLAKAIGDAYGAARQGGLAPAPPTDRWRGHVEALAKTRADLPAPMPAEWRRLRAHLAAYGGHAVVELPFPLTSPLTGGPPDCRTDAERVPLDPKQLEAVAATALVDRRSVVLAALAEPLLQGDLGGFRAPLDVAPFLTSVDQRGPGDEHCIGAWTASTVVAVPVRRTGWLNHLAQVDELRAQAVGHDGLAWASHAFDSAGVVPPAASLRPTLSFSAPPPVASLDLVGTDITLLGRPYVPTAGQLAYEHSIEDGTWLRCESGRFWRRILEDLALGAATALANAARECA